MRYGLGVDDKLSYNVSNIIGIGVASGATKLESVKRKVTFPATGNALDYRLETAFGTAAAFCLARSRRAQA